MWIVTVIVLFLGGMLAASGLILSKKPDAAALIEKVRPWQTWIGVLLLVWGIVDLVNLVRYLGNVSFSGYLLLFLLTVLTELALGFLLSFELLSKYIFGRNEQAQARADQAHQRIDASRGPLGLVAMVLAVLFLIMSL